MDGSEILYRKKQHLRHSFYTILATFLFFVLFLKSFEQWFYNNPLGENPLNNISLAFLNAFFAFGLYFLFTLEYEFVITTGGIYFRISWYHKKFRHIKREELLAYELKSVKQYPKIKSWFPYLSKNYNVFKFNENYLLKLDTKDGRTLLLGAEASEELANALHHLVK